MNVNLENLRKVLDIFLVIYSSRTSIDDSILNSYDLLAQQEYLDHVNKESNILQLFPETALKDPEMYNQYLAATQLYEFSQDNPCIGNIKKNEDAVNDKNEDIILQEYDIFPKQIMKELYDERPNISIEDNYFLCKKIDYQKNRKDELEKYLIKFNHLCKAEPFDSAYQNFLKYLNSIQCRDYVPIDEDDSC